MKSFLSLFFTLILLLQSSCGSIVGPVLGIKEPSIKPITKVVSYAEKHNFSPFYIAQRDFLAELAEMNNYAPGNLHPIQLKFFNAKTGEALARYVSCEGSLKRLNTLAHFPPFSDEKDLARYNLHKELVHYKDLNGKSVKIDPSAEYVFIHYWGTFTGKPSRDIQKKLLTYCKKHKDKHIQLISVNILELD